jgi:S-phase kinase-associated protein 1
MDSMVKLMSSDGEILEVLTSIASKSVTIDNMLNDIGDNADDNPVPLPNVSSTILKMVIKYVTYHKENDVKQLPEGQQDIAPKTSNIEPWDEEFCKVDQSLLFELILAANYLDIKPLLDLSCKTVANMMKGKTPDEIRKTFNIKNDFTPEEEEQVRKENDWCEEAK